MNEIQGWILEELIEAFYNVITDFRHGIIDDNTMKEKLLKLAERYERSIGQGRSEKQKDLF